MGRLASLWLMLCLFVWRRSGSQTVDQATVESDILQRAERNAVDSLWPMVNGVISVPFVINSSLSAKLKDINAAFTMISKYTCITYKKRTAERDYLTLMPGYSMCASFVGYNKGPQPIYIGNSCGVGNIVHELLHALGFHHEHTRYDRDKYITVHFENVKTNCQGDFMIKHGNTLGLEYDFESIMHYGRYHFSSNGKPTIEPKVANQNIGQRNHLSHLDVERIRKLYKCDVLTKAVKSPEKNHH